MSREISEYDDVSQFGENKRQLTVQRNDSSISNGSTQAENSHYYAILLCGIKWFIAIFLCAVVLFCVVASKICLLVLGQHYRSVKRAGNSTAEKIEAQTCKQALFLMLLFTLMIPHFASFIYASWTSLRRKSRPWPTKQGFVVVRIIKCRITTNRDHVTKCGLLCKFFSDKTILISAFREV